MQEGFYPNLMPSAPQNINNDSDDEKRDRKYYKLLAIEYKEENKELIENSLDVLKNNKKYKTENKKLKKENSELKKENTKLSIMILEVMEEKNKLQEKLSKKKRRFFFF